MSRRLRKSQGFLRILCKARPNHIPALIEGASDDILRTLQDCHLNILKGSVRLTPSEQKKLAHHKKTIKKIINKRSGLNTKRKLLVQKGGAFLGLLLRPILRELATLLL